MIICDKLAILLATYNGEKYLKEQLNSLLNQTFMDWVAYIHDDGSSDGTLQIIDEYCRLYPSHFVFLQGKPCGGAKNNFYYLLKEVSAPLYMFCDQDDVWLPQKIEKSIETIKTMNCNRATLVFGNLKIVDSNLDVIHESMWDYYKFDLVNLNPEKIILRNVVTGCTILINNKLRDLMIQFKNIENTPMHDKWGALIAIKFGEIKYYSEPLILYRQHEDNTVGAVDNKRISFWLSRLRKYKDIKKNYCYTQRQAKEFSEVFNLPVDDPLSIYGNADNYNKIQRICIYLKYGFRTNSITQTLGLLLFG